MLGFRPGCATTYFLFILFPEQEKDYFIFGKTKKANKLKLKKNEIKIDISFLSSVLHKYINPFTR